MTKLQKKRNGYTQELAIGGVKLFLRTGEYPNGTLGEIFLTLAKQGTVVRGMADSFAISMSLGLQHGVPLEKYIDVFVHTRFPPEGVVRGHDYIKTATSFADLVVRDLGIHYLKRMDLANTQPEQLVEVVSDASVDIVIASKAAKTATSVQQEVIPPMVDPHEQMAQDTANKLLEPVLLIRNPPSGREYQSVIPYVISESLATKAEVLASDGRFIPQLTIG